MLVVIRGAGDIATGVALRLFRCGMHIVMCDLEIPTSIRRTVCFSEALRLGTYRVESVEAHKVANAEEALSVAHDKKIAVIADPEAHIIEEIHPVVVVDAILAKKNLGTTKDMAPIVVACGPGFEAQKDCDAVVETMRGHYLGRVWYSGKPIPNTNIPGLIGGFAGERVMRAPADGVFEDVVEIGDKVKQGDVCGTVNGVPMRATLDGVVRGLIQTGAHVHKGMKSGDVDPRGVTAYARCSSEKALAVGGGVMEAILNLSGILSDRQPLVAEQGERVVRDDEEQTE